MTGADRSDFGSAAADYARHRGGFPASFFERMIERGFGRGRLLDVGTGTGTLSRGFAARGARSVGLDRSLPMMSAARALAAGDAVAWVSARAEALPFRAASFGSFVAGQCWHWFDGPRAASECARVLAPGGRVGICHYSYLPEPDSVAGVTEDVILAHNPTWPMAGLDGIYDQWRPHLEGAGFEELESFHWVEDSEYSLEAWRGRIRACNGVIELSDPARIAAFDADLARTLTERFGPGPYAIPHRVFALVGRRSSASAATS